MNTTDYDRERIKSAMEAATESLLGVQVEIVLRDPANKGFIGQAYKKSNGMHRIDLSPSLPLEKIYHVWLHEVGHIVNGDVDEQGPIPVENLESASFEIPALGTTEGILEYNTKPDEVQANDFAFYLDRLATNKAFWLYGDTEIETRLRVLMNVALQKD